MISKIDLSGEWKLHLDKELKNEYPQFEDSIILPNTISNARKGEYNPRRETGFLTDTYLFEGNAWFSKKVDFGNCKERVIKLFIERTRKTTLYIDGIKVDCCENLCTPHVYDITDFVSPGEHEITICVSNKGYKTAGGHMTSPDTQTNWNGITGRIEVQFFCQTHLKNLMIFPDVMEKTLRITGNIVGNPQGKVAVSAQSINSGKIHYPETVEYDYSGGRFDILYSLGENALLWDEYYPNLYRVKIALDNDVYEMTTGLREFKTDGDKFAVNGRRVFLRGKHDGMIFPRTGYAPTTVEEWIKVFEIAKEYGMNHYRFHTCCPPEAAFYAADILGFYLEPELPFWGTVTTPDDPDHNAEQQQFLVDEGIRILSEFGNHPSFCMMSLGNELWGSKEILNDILGRYKAYDNRHLYTQGSNNFQWCPCVLGNDDFFVGVRLSGDRLIRGSYAMCDAPQGHIQVEKPSSIKNYDGAVYGRSHGQKSKKSGDIQIQFGNGVKTVQADKESEEFHPGVPIITHEIGQFETYPDFDEIEKYTGSLKPKNFEIFKERLIEKGMIHMAKDFFECSGKLAVQCYKDELESVFRSTSLAGFQLLDLQDFSGQGTALVGILDAFMDSKGLISAEKWREFCSEAVLLAEFGSYTYEVGENFSASINLTYYGLENLKGKVVDLMISDHLGNEVCKESFIINISTDENHIEIGKVAAKLPDFEKAEKLTLSLEIKETQIRNSYDIYVYPKINISDLQSDCIFNKIDSRAEALLSQGKKILLMQMPDNGIKGCYCTDFWCYPMFRSISESMGKPEPIGTMGLVIDNKHPALAEFPCEKYSTHQWWEIVENSCSEILDDSFSDKNIIIQVIDNFERNHCLGLLYEYEYNGGAVVVCNCDYEKLLRSCEGKQFLHSLIRYVES